MVVGNIVLSSNVVGKSDLLFSRTQVSHWLPRVRICYEIIIDVVLGEISIFESIGKREIRRQGVVDIFFHILLGD